uniref:Uncharacterized protein n=1 Tax=Arundo donax TaxID=35708 RepID=A0A0A9C8Y1_ARUDO
MRGGALLRMRGGGDEGGLSGHGRCGSTCHP